MVWICAAFTSFCLHCTCTALFKFKSKIMIILVFTQFTLRLTPEWNANCSDCCKVRRGPLTPYNSSHIPFEFKQLTGWQEMFRRAEGLPHHFYNKGGSERTQNDSDSYSSREWGVHIWKTVREKSLPAKIEKAALTQMGSEWYTGTLS